jgi:hypothetical protein
MLTLIRLMSDGKNNPEHADKMIAIDGLPEEWFFDCRKDHDDKGAPDQRLFLRDPWEVDITENIPEGIRAKFCPLPIQVWFETPMEIRPGTYQSAPAMEWIRYMKTAYGFRLNVQTNAGRAMWDQILDLLDRETPRSQRIPEPAVVGNKIQWTLQTDKVPFAKLTGTVAIVPPEQIVIPEIKPVARPDQYACRTCGNVFDKERGRWMHERKSHGIKDSFVKEKVAA